MKYATALIAAAVGASAHGHHAWANNGTRYTTEVVDQYVTYCPGPMAVTHGGEVYTVTKPTTLTITNCPCTITRPVVTASTVICNTCTGAASQPTEPASAPAVTPNVTPVIQPTGGITATPSAPLPTGGAGKAAALSGAGLAGVVGVAAFLL